MAKSWCKINRVNSSLQPVTLVLVCQLHADTTFLLAPELPDSFRVFLLGAAWIWLGGHIPKIFVTCRHERSVREVPYVLLSYFARSWHSST